MPSRSLSAYGSDVTTNKLPANCSATYLCMYLHSSSYHLHLQRFGGVMSMSRLLHSRCWLPCSTAVCPSLFLQAKSQRPTVECTLLSMSNVYCSMVLARLGQAMSLNWPNRSMSYQWRAFDKKYTAGLYDPFLDIHSIWWRRLYTSVHTRTLSLLCWASSGNSPTHACLVDLCIVRAFLIHDCTGSIPPIPNLTPTYLVVPNSEEGQLTVVDACYAY